MQFAPTYSYGLISNCLFLRIILNGCAAKPLSTLSWDYSSFEASGSHVCVPSNWCNFDLRKEIEGFISTYVMTAVHFFLSGGAVCCPIVSLCKCANASCNPMYLHPLALWTRPRRTRTWREISASSSSLTGKERSITVQGTSYIAAKSYQASPFLVLSETLTFH